MREGISETEAEEGPWMRKRIGNGPGVICTHVCQFPKMNVNIMDCKHILMNKKIKPAPL